MHNCGRTACCWAGLREQIEQEAEEGGEGRMTLLSSMGVSIHTICDHLMSHHSCSDFMATATSCPGDTSPQHLSTRVTVTSLLVFILSTAFAAALEASTVIRGIGEWGVKYSCRILHSSVKREQTPKTFHRRHGTPVYIVMGPLLGLTL